MNKIYILTTFWLDDEPCKTGYYHSNCVKQGFWTSQKDAEQFLLRNWDYLHEHWNNAAVIEEYNMGSTEMQWKPKQWWYYSENPQEKLPELLNEVPERMKFNDGKQTWTLGR